MSRVGKRSKKVGQHFRCRSVKSLIREYVGIQAVILAKFREELGERDWVYLTDVPRRGTIQVHDQEWAFTKHGTGVRFENGRTVIDANRHLEACSGIFDAGRVADYAESLGEKAALWRDDVIKLDYSRLSSGLREMSRCGEISKCTDLHGEIYRLTEIA